MFEGDGNYEVLHSCENRGCFEISYYVQRHYACHNTQLIKTYHQLGRYLNIIIWLIRFARATALYFMFKVMQNICIYSDLFGD